MIRPSVRCAAFQMTPLLMKFLWSIASRRVCDERGGSAGMIEGERKKFSSLLLQKLEQFVKLMFAEGTESGIAQDLLSSIWFSVHDT